MMRIFTRNGHNWTLRYRNLVGAAKRLGVENAILNGEIVVLNQAGLSDFAALRNAITLREQDLYFVAFDLLRGFDGIAIAGTGKSKPVGDPRGSRGGRRSRRSGTDRSMSAVTG